MQEKEQLSHLNTEQVWDYIVVGTGMGGGTLGFALAQAGFSVLFLEKGQAISHSSLQGKFAEIFHRKNETQALKHAGRFSDDIYDYSLGASQIKVWKPLIGSGVGGSTALYGMILERFLPVDFEHWPISYATLEPFYEQAESLFQVRKTQTFHHKSVRLLAEYLKSKGLHPIHLSVANQNKKNCGECQGFLCKRACKNDAGTICIEPSVKQYHASLLTECEVQSVEMSGSLASGVTCSYAGQSFFLQAKNVVLAAGALKTPLILQNSIIPDQSGLIGRNLMRHYCDIYALKMHKGDAEHHILKELGFNDFYRIDGQKFGTVQSFGYLPPTEVIARQMRLDLQDAHILLYWLFRPLFPLIYQVLKKVFSNRLALSSIVEDTPVFENRVWSEQGNICMEYHISPADQAKIDLLRAKLKALFKPFGLLFIARAEKNEMLAHACGTCKMGTDPKGSVVDTTNRVHGTDNLYVVDSSFFPTSSGINPALTIAANALRVADMLINRAKRVRQQ